VQGVPVPGPVAEQDRGRPHLPGVVAHPQPLIEGVRPTGRGARSLAHQSRAIGSKPRVQRLLEPFDRLRVRSGEVTVLALPEPVPAHGDGGAEALALAVELAELLRFPRA